MAGNLLMGISQDEHERAVFRSRRMYQTDLDSNLRTARDNGIKIGEERGEKRGEKNGKIAVARNLLSASVPISQIALYTELTESEIRGLLS